MSAAARLLRNRWVLWGIGGTTAAGATYVLVPRFLSDSPFPPPPPGGRPPPPWTPPSRKAMIDALRRSSLVSTFDDVKDTQPSDEEYDLLIVGGGSSGAGIALDAASRGLKVALVEKDDFSAGV